LQIIYAIKIFLFLLECTYQLSKFRENIIKISINFNDFNKFSSQYKNDKTGEIISRRYTPISLSEIDSKLIKLLVKVYNPIENVFPSGGLISQYIENNQELEIEYPYGKLVYRGEGNLGFRYFATYQKKFLFFFKNIYYYLILSNIYKLLYSEK